MDLSFARLERGGTVTALPTELAVLMASVTGRQAGTPTARVQARLGWRREAASLLKPADGAFNSWVAILLTSTSTASVAHSGAFNAPVKTIFT